MSKNKILSGVVAVLVIALAAWWLGWFGSGEYSSDPAVAELQKQRDAGFSRMEQMSDTERRAAREDFRGRMDQLTDEQRQEFFRSSSGTFAQMMEQRVDRLLAMSPEEQRREIDARIDEMQAGDGPPRDGPPDGRRPGNPAQFDAMRKRMLDATTPDQRAKFEKARKLFSERMEQRGLEPGPGRGFL